MNSPLILGTINNKDMSTTRNVFIWALTILSLFVCISISGQTTDEGRNLELHEISFTNKFLKSFMKDSIQNMAMDFRMNNELDVLCIYFRKEKDTILFWPRSRQYGITEWFLSFHINHIVGYYEKGGVWVLVLCEDTNKYAGYFKIKKHTITLHIEDRSPSNEPEFVFKEYSIQSNKPMSLVKENLPKRKVLFW